MNVTRQTIVLALCLVTTGAAAAAEKKRNLLIIGQSKGYQHDSVSTAMVTLYNLGRSSKTMGHLFPDRLHGHHQEAPEMGGQESECLRCRRVLHRRRPGHG